MQHWRLSILFACIIAMIAGLFLSRAVLSIAMICFVAFSFFHDRPGQHFRNFFNTPLLWGMSLLFIVPFISGSWSADQGLWMFMMQVKAPLFFLPLAFAGPFTFSKQQWQVIACIFISMVVAGTLWSMFRYAADMKAVNEGYLRAKSMLTPLENDHVRFSWLVNVAVILSAGMYWITRQEHKKLSLFFVITAAWLVIFLHLLAARTGLFSFYICVLLLGLWLIIRKMKWRAAVDLFLMLIALPVIAYFIVPTFKNRVNYFRYEFAYGKNASYLPGATDAVRIISLRAGWNIMKEHAAMGVGFGDIQAAAIEWYDKHYPGMLERDKIYPSGEWMMYGSGAGIPGFLVFTISMLIPFFTRMRQKLVWVMLNVTAAFSFIADIGLEVQFGVFIYSFVVLCCWKWGNAQKV